MRKRKKNDSAGEGAYWMDTYGDMVTLLLTFFVLLFSFSTIDAAKWMELANALSGTPVMSIAPLSATEVNAPAIDGQENGEDPALTPEPSPSSSQNAMNAMQMAEIKQKFSELYEKIKQHIETNGLQDKLNVEMQDNAILMTMNETALFDSGSAELKPSAKEMLPAICDILKQYDSLIRWIRIEGHTDNVPIQNSQYKDNWDLSSARSLSVLHYVVLQNLDATKLSQTGYGEYHPVADNGTEEGKARNRRVDFKIESILED